MGYTTNIIEGLNRQFRQITKNKPSFTNDDSLRRITNCHSNIHITTANLFQSDSGAPEISAVALSGVWAGTNKNTAGIGFYFHSNGKDYWEDDALAKVPIRVFDGSGEHFVSEGDEAHYGATTLSPSKSKEFLAITGR